MQSELGRPNIAAYTASKSAVKMFTDSTARCPEPRASPGLFTIPGYFKSELTEVLVNDEYFGIESIDRMPSHCWSDVEDLVGAAVFLSSNAASFANGHILNVDGGVISTLRFAPRY